MNAVPTVESARRASASATPLHTVAAALACLMALAPTATGRAQAVGDTTEAATPPAAEDAGPSVSVRLGRGLEVESADGRFAMQLRGRAQLRYEAVIDDRGQPGTAGDGVGSSTFQARRVRLLLQGHLFNDDWNYYVQLGFSNGDTEPDLRLPLRDAYMTWSGIRDLNVRFGQGKVPYGRQRVVSSSALQFPDRSIATQEFNLDRDVGIQAFSTDLFGLGDRLGYNVGIYGGDGRNRTNTADFGMLYVARLTFRPFGNFEDFSEADFTRSPEPRLAISIGGAVNRNSVRHRSTFTGTYTLGSFDFVHGGADLVFKMHGLSVQSEFFVRTVTGTRSRADATDPMDVVTETARTGIGYYVQAGYLATEHLEIGARFGENRPFTAQTTSLPREGELGGGLSWYFQKHDFKIQADYFYLYQGDIGDGTARHQIRVQSQFYL